MAAVVIIDRLPYDFSDEQLLQLTRPFGHVLTARLVRGPEGRSLQFGFVHYQDLSAAKLAIEMLRGREIGGHVIVVGLAQTTRLPEGE